MAQVYASTSDTGFLPFTPGAAIRRIGGENILPLGGGRALLMQIAHPLLARGVAEHSNFGADRRRRLLGTLHSSRDQLRHAGAGAGSRRVRQPDARASDRRRLPGVRPGPDGLGPGEGLTWGQITSAFCRHRSEHPGSPSHACREGCDPRHGF